MAHRFTGKVARLYVRREHTNIRLDIEIPEEPEENYFRLELNHPNYNALYALALSAAINGYNLSIRTVDEVVRNEPAPIEYMVVDW